MLSSNGQHRAPIQPSLSRLILATHLMLSLLACFQSQLMKVLGRPGCECTSKLSINITLEDGKHHLEC